MTRRLAGAALVPVLLAAARAAADPAAAATLDEGLKRLVARPGGLTAEAVARRAAATSFDLRGQAREIQAAAAGVDQALVGYFPRLVLAARFTRFSPVSLPPFGNIVAAPGAAPGPLVPGTPLMSVPITFPVFLNQTILQATLAIPLSDYFLRVPRGHASAARSEKAARLEEAAARLKVATDGRIAYYAWARARLQVLVAEQALKLARALLVDTRHAFEVGVRPRADVLRVEAQVAASELLVARARSLAALLEEQVRIAMHDPTRAAYEIGEDLRADLPPLPRVHRLDDLYAEALDRRLELRALAETAAALREQVRLAKAGIYPRLDAVLDAQLANPNPRIIPNRDQFDGTFSASVQLSWSPSEMAAAAAQAQVLEAQAARIDERAGQLRDAIRGEVAQAFQAMREATIAIGTTARAVAAAEESYRVRRELYRAGRATAVEVTDAETELTRARLEAINARVDLRLARVRLLHAIGRDVVEQGHDSSSTR